MGNENTFNKDNSLGILLARVSRLVGTERRMKFESIGLHHGQAMVLHRLWREDGISQASLAEALHIAPPTASSTLKRMERDGWITRRRDEKDQRIVRVYLTEKAKQQKVEALASFTAMDQELAEILTEGEVSDLKHALLKVYRYLGAKHPSADGSFCSGHEKKNRGENK